MPSPWRAKVIAFSFSPALPSAPAIGELTSSPQPLHPGIFWRLCRLQAQTCLGGAWSVPRRQGCSWILPDVGGLSSGPDGGQEDGWEALNFRVSQRRRTQATSHRCTCFSGEGRGDLISRDLGAGSAGSWVPEALVPESSGRIRAPDACGASPRPRGRLAHRTQSHRAAAPRPGPARYFIYICIIL